MGEVVARVVVAAATGNIGASVLEALAVDPQVAHVVGVARRLPELTLPKTTFVASDIQTGSLEPLLDGADVLVHLAWAFQPTHHPLETWDVNVVGTMRALDAAARAGTPTIAYASSVGAHSPAQARRSTSRGPRTACPPPRTDARRRTSSACSTRSSPKRWPS